ncbi:hypothetical protein EON63_12460 [archaeon]|nr:MAG: hypothetical protein EON63_12460 [archaeon]
MASGNYSSAMLVFLAALLCHLLCCRLDGSTVLVASETTSSYPIRVVPFIHVAKKYFHTRFLASRNTWLNCTPPWADVFLFNLVKEGPAPGPYETILIDTEEYGHNSNVQFFKTLEILYNRYKKTHTAEALKHTWYLKLDDDAYVHWPGLYAALYGLTASLPAESNLPLYYGNCNCKTGPHVCKQDKYINCTLIGNMPPFEYICGGSGILFNHEMVRVLLDYELSVGCPYSLEDITIGHCVKELSRSRQHPVQCTNDYQHFKTLNNYEHVRHYDQVRHDPAVLGKCMCPVYVHM